jgi:phosphotransferase system enzyme I (PtsI)
MKKYIQQKNQLLRQYHRLEKEKDLKAETLDGFQVELYANVNDISDLELAHRYGVFGVGLFRSEYLFLENQALFFDEEKQIAIYRHLFSLAQKAPVTFRVMDLGGDKCADLFREISKGTNSTFGQRGIRFLLSHPDIFATQLKAVLQAAVGFQVRILFPLIGEVEELRQVQRIIQEVKIELHKRSVSFLQDPLLGCMLEVPSAVLICDVLARESDFLALGTNDLIQYTLGVDRNDFNTDSSYLHPAVIRMIRLAILESKRHFKSVTVCGDMASNPLCVPLLVGLGVRISCDPRFIPVIKQTIRRLSLLNAIDIAEHVLTLETSVEIAEYLSEEMEKLELESEEFPMIF